MSFKSYFTKLLDSSISKNFNAQNDNLIRIVNESLKKLNDSQLEYLLFNIAKNSINNLESSATFAPPPPNISK